MQPFHRSSKKSWPALIAASLNIALLFSYIGLWVMAAQQDILWRADFTAFYTAGVMVRNGTGTQLYDRDLQASYQQDILDGRSFSDGVLPYNYPPHLALIFSRLAYLSLYQAYSIWAILQVAMTILLVILLSRTAHHWQPIERWSMVAACLALPGLMRNYLIGALSLWMLVIVLSWYEAIKNRSEGSAGLMLLLGTVKPQLIVYPAVITLVTRRWKAILITIFSGILVLGLTAWALGWQVWLNFLSVLVDSGNFINRYGINPAAMINFKGMLTIWFGSAYAELINFLSLGAFLVSLGFTVWLWWGKQDGNQPIFPLRLAFSILLSLFFSLHINLQDSLMLAVPGILFYEYLRQRNLPRGVYSTVALASPALFLLDEFYLSAQLPIRLTVIVMIVMLVWMGYYLRFESHQPAQRKVILGSPNG